MCKNFSHGTKLTVGEYSTEYWRSDEESRFGNSTYGDEHCSLCDRRHGEYDALLVSRNKWSYDRFIRWAVAAVPAPPADDLDTQGPEKSPVIHCGPKAGTRWIRESMFTFLYFLYFRVKAKMH